MNSCWPFNPSTPSGEEVVTAHLLCNHHTIDRVIAVAEGLEGAAGIEEIEDPQLGLYPHANIIVLCQSAFIFVRLGGL